MKLVGITAVTVATLLGGVILVIVVWAIAGGEQQSHEWEANVAHTYRAAKPGVTREFVADRLGHPYTSFRWEGTNCIVYRVLLTSSEKVPYDFCFERDRLVAKWRTWVGVE